MTPEEEMEGLHRRAESLCLIAPCPDDCVAALQCARDLRPAAVAGKLDEDRKAVWTSYISVMRGVVELDKAEEGSQAYLRAEKSTLALLMILLSSYQKVGSLPSRHIWRHPLPPHLSLTTARPGFWGTAR